ncbi:molybdopterin-binding protein [Chryseobacterium terrae]|uniref:Molybdopterin-binding protein n=1 Tax=Chryseobacterium terrae TaxID=3163299 RepID=A0ABW8Y0Y0_9FLAO
MKKSILLFFVITCISIFGQEKKSTTTEFRVIGQVKKELTISLHDLEKYPAQNIKDLPITNHLGEARYTAKNLKGILLKDLLKDLQINEDSPKKLSEFYFVFTAVDQYKVVFSWNEIFNSSTGDHLYVITEKDGTKIKDMDDRILIVTTSDFKTGRRHIKALSKIEVRRVQ